MALSAEDRLAVYELLSRYIYVIDGDRNEEKFFDLFTDDAVFEGPSGRFGGHAEIQNWLSSSSSRRIAGYRHLTSNIFVDGDGNEAELHATFTTVITAFDGNDVDTNPSHTRLYQAGSYDCEARKVDGVWRLSKRTVKVFDELLK